MRIAVPAKVEECWAHPPGKPVGLANDPPPPLILVVPVPYLPRGKNVWCILQVGQKAGPMGPVNFRGSPGDLGKVLSQVGHVQTTAWAGWKD